VDYPRFIKLREEEVKGIKLREEEVKGIMG
jgi:hypothetical protein